MEKQKISAFEYAIREVCEPETLDKFEPLTKEEELKIRRDKLLAQAKRMRIINQ